MANNSLFSLGVLCFVVGLFTMLTGSRSRGGMRHRGTSIEASAWFILIALGMLLIVISTSLP